MSPPDDKTMAKPAGPEAKTSPEPAPPSWKLIAIGLSIAGIAAVLSAVLLAGFLESRPVDLREHTRKRASDLERLLAYNQVPESSVTQSAEEERHDGTARWTYREYRVDLPPTLSLAGVERLIRRNMADRNVSVFDEPDTPADRTVLRLAAAGQQFATLTLTGTPDRANLTEASRRLARETVDLLNGLVPAVERIERGPVESRENGEALWEFAAIDVWIDTVEQVQTLVTEANAALSRNDVHLSVDPDEGTGETGITVSFHGLECVRIAVHAPVPQPTEPGPAGESMPEEAGSELSADGVPDPESLPLDSEHLNGDAREPAAPAKSFRAGDPLKVAIIVDDGGYGGEITQDVLALDPRLTLSILPRAPHSTDTAQRAAELGFEVMLHMPMENSSDHNSYPGQITVDMPAEEIHQLTAKALADVPGVVGINNHTGSRFTSDPNAMRAFLTGIQPLSLFFVDSRTISTSKAYEMAREMGIPCAARDLFLDHEPDKKYIRERFNQLIELCEKQGSAIGICHFRRNSVSVLQEKLPELEKHGITLVHASELID